MKVSGNASSVTIQTQSQSRKKKFPSRMMSSICWKVLWNKVKQITILQWFSALTFQEAWTQPAKLQAKLTLNLVFLRKKSTCWSSSWSQEIKLSSTSYQEHIIKIKLSSRENNVFLVLLSLKFRRSKRKILIKKLASFYSTMKSLS